MRIRKILSINLIIVLLCMVAFSFSTSAIVVNAEVISEGFTKRFTSFEEAWAAANKTSNQVTMKLYSDWEAKDNLLGTGDGFEGGQLLVNPSCNITLDLNGHTINRNLNSSLTNGGVIHVLGEGTLNIIDSDPSATNYSSTIKGGVLTGGYNESGAGGITIDYGGKVNMTGGSIAACISDKEGGAVAMYGEAKNETATTFNAEGTGFYTNRTMESIDECDGGTFYIKNSFVKLNKCTIENSYSEDYGGAIYKIDGNLSIRDSYIFGCVAKDDGGALYLTGQSEITNTAFKDNYTEDNGGAVYLGNGGAAFLRCTFEQNEATYGSAIYLNSNKTVLAGGKIINNKATKAGAVYFADSYTLCVQNDLVVKDNKDSENKANVCVHKKGKIYSGDVEDSAEIHIERKTKDSWDIVEHVSPLSNYQNIFVLDDNGSLSYSKTTDEKINRATASIVGNGNVAIIIAIATIMIIVLVIAIVIKKKGERKYERDNK